MNLDHKQIQVIKTYLKKQGGIDHKFLDEVLDHYCTMIEDHMNSGISFEDSLQICTQKFTVDSLKKMNKQMRFIHFSKSLYMKIAVVLLLVTSSITFKIFTENNISDTEVATQKEMNDFLTTYLAYSNIDPPEIWPIQNNTRVSSGYGMRIHPVEKVEKFHFGIDIPAKHGTPVIATNSGIIKETGFTNNYGNYIIISHDETYTSRYSQLSEINVSEGDEIVKGSIIGKVGSSGRSTAPHLHFEIKESGKFVDPIKFLKA